MPEQEHNESSSFAYPNSPDPRTGEGGKQQGKNPESLIGHESIEIPREPLHGGKGIDSFHLRDTGIHLYNRCKDSLLYRGGDALVNTMKHNTAACHGAGILDDRTVANLRSLTKEVEQAQGYHAKKQIFEERVRPFLLGLKATKIGGTK